MSEWRRLASRRGVAVTAMRCDVGSPSDVARMALALGKTPIRTVVHSAGVLDDALLANQSAASIRRVFAPKVGGAWLLHAATLAQTEPLDAFVVFSSVASSLGGAGQTNYAAANASLDALTALRQAEGAAGSIALQWGAVSGVGMGAATGADVQLQRRGLPPSARIWSAPPSAPLSKALARRPSPSPSSLPTGLATENGHQLASRRICPRSPARRRRLRRAAERPRGSVNDFVGVFGVRGRHAAVAPLG